MVNEEIYNKITSAFWDMQSLYDENRPDYGCDDDEFAQDCEDREKEAIEKFNSTMEEFKKELPVPDGHYWLTLVMQNDGRAPSVWKREYSSSNNFQKAYDALKTFPAKDVYGKCLGGWVSDNTGKIWAMKLLGRMM